MDQALQPDPYEGSTRRWETDAELMRVELAAHDAVLRTAIELALPVRKGVGTGEAELRGEDYFGPALT